MTPCCPESAPEDVLFKEFSLPSRVEWHAAAWGLNWPRAQYACNGPGQSFGSSMIMLGILHPKKERKKEFSIIVLVANRCWRRGDFLGPLELARAKTGDLTDGCYSMKNRRVCQ